MRVPPSFLALAALVASGLVGSALVGSAGFGVAVGFGVAAVFLVASVAGFDAVALVVSTSGEGFAWAGFGCLSSAVFGRLLAAARAALALLAVSLAREAPLLAVRVFACDVLTPLVWAAAPVSAALLAPAVVPLLVLVVAAFSAVSEALTAGVAPAPLAAGCGFMLVGGVAAGLAASAVGGVAAGLAASVVGGAAGLAASVTVAGGEASFAAGSLPSTGIRPPHPLHLMA